MWPGAQRLAQPGRPGLMGAGGWEGAACVPTAQVSKLDSEGRTALRGWPGPPNAGSATVQALSGQWGPPPPALGLCPLPGLLPHQARGRAPSLPTGTSATSKRRRTDCRLFCSHAYTVLHPAALWLAGAGGGAETPRLAEGRGSTPRFSGSFLTYKAPRCIHSRLSFRDSQSQAGTSAAAHWL